MMSVLRRIQNIFQEKDVGLTEDERGEKLLLKIEKKKLVTETRALALLIAFNALFTINIVPTSSMEPTLKTGGVYLTQHTFVRSPNVGEFIVFRSNSIDGNNFYVKRIVGVGGDTIEVRDRTLFRNGEAIEEDYLKEDMSFEIPPITIPEGEFFVLGDNRNNSYDSKYWGTVKRGEILGVTLPVSVKTYDTVSSVANTINPFK